MGLVCVLMMGVWLAILLHRFDLLTYFPYSSAKHDAPNLRNFYKFQSFSNCYSYGLQAIRKQPLTVYGDGKQTRSFQYVSDLVCSGLLSFLLILCFLFSSLILFWRHYFPCIFVCFPSFSIGSWSVIIVSWRFCILNERSNMIHLPHAKIRKSIKVVRKC